MKHIGNFVSCLGGLASLLGAFACAGPEGAEATDATDANEVTSDASKAAEAKAAEASDEGEVATAKQALSWRTYHGGNGGVGSYMPWGKYDGIQTHTGSYVDWIRFHYYSPATWTSPVGGSGGGSNPSDVCSNWAIGIYGRSGSYIDGIGLICGNPSDHSGKYQTTYRGGGGGSYFYDECPVGEMVKYIYVRSGSYLDAIQIYCAPYSS
jgi:hypothetical protein